MRISKYDSLPAEAVLIRTEVFMTEQRFKDEFDDTDETAVHYVAFDDDGTPVGVCRTFPGSDPGERVFGRLSVRKPWRGKGIGREIISFAENNVREEGAVSLRLHAQVTAAGFYEKLGYTEFGEPDYDEHVLHIWMKKDLT
ncbi:MAG: GNAT family N-acetyltransferase [Oscillospiraceae bacterium]|nr:GNAT family N-acetyltransferase [Oscillospiraceae bacterium]